MIAIVDYGVGNLFSLKSSFDAIGVEAFVSGNEKDIINAVVNAGYGASVKGKNQVKRDLENGSEETAAEV